MEFNLGLVLEIALSVVVGGIVLLIVIKAHSGGLGRMSFITHNIKPFREHCSLDITAVGDHELVRDRRSGKETIYII